MIKEKHLVPGRVLLRATDHPTKKDRDGDPVCWWRPCMVVAYYTDIKRRHSKSTAPILGWEVLVIWWGSTVRPIEHITIPPEHRGWKPAPF